MELEDLVKHSVQYFKENPKALSELCSQYKKIFHEDLATTCDNCISDGIIRLRIYLNKGAKMEKEVTVPKSKFKLKNEDRVVIYVQELHMHVTKGNLTDELAIELLKRNKKNIALFDVYPDNWQELASIPKVGAATKEKIAKTTPVDEAKLEDKKEKQISDLVNKFKKDELLEILYADDEDAAKEEKGNKTDIARKIVEKQYE